MSIELPDLRRVGIIALDTETKDDGLANDVGSAWPWNDGYVCGVSVAWRADGEMRSLYISLAHPDSENVDRDTLVRWLKDHTTSNVRFITQNGLYDYGWICTDLGVAMPPAERLEEIGALATIVNENRFSYKLDALCRWRGIAGKDETALLEGCAALGLIPKGRKKFNPQAHIWQLPARFVHRYAEQDTISTLLLFESLDPVLDRENTRDAYRLEVDLLPMVHAMRRRGIRIDIPAAERARDDLLAKRDTVLAELSNKLGAPVTMHELDRGAWLAKTCDTLGIKYPRTEKGNPSFRAGNTGWMAHHPHWFCQLKVHAERLHRAGAIVLDQQILGHVINGRVHADVHPHRSEEGGTRSLRFSYSSPPLQQMPKHNEELAPLIRGVFLPEDGEVWAKCDVSQQEFRFVVHYAARHKLTRTHEAIQRYRNDPATDYHALVAEWTGIVRQSAKNTNFAKIYGAGVRKFAEMIGKPEAEAHEIYEKYDRELPFVAQLSALCQHAAQRNGYLKLYNCARRHFNQFAPGGTWKKGAGPCEHDEAIRRINDPDHPWHRKQLWRASTYKALNALIQGSAAIHTKLWMREVWREGIVPMLQMHDSLDLSVTSPEQAELVARLGCEAVKLEVPMKVDIAYGRTWGDAEHTWAELMSPHVEPAVELPDDQARAQREGSKFSNDFDGAIEPTFANETVETNANDASEPADVDKSIPQDDICFTCLDEMRAAESSPHNTIAIVTPISTGKVLPWEGVAQFTALPNNKADSIDNYTDDVEGYSKGKINCPFHDDRTPSCQLYADGHYHCFGCGAHGMIAEDMDLPDDVLARAADVKDDTGTLERGLELWDESKPITGTLAERYLADTRKLDLAALPADIGAVLRFHPRCPFGANGARHPCLIALFRDVESDVPAGIHRIGLTPDAKKLKRLTLGRWPSPRAIKLWPVTHKLTIGEGIETVLGAITLSAIHRDAPTPPAWAMGPKTDIARFPVLPIKALTVLVDRGDPAALDGAVECAKRYAEAGICARWLRTVHVKDFNDLVMSHEGNVH
jgi:DNA polymerase I-like protein with 3'-5' exonuclease and polymerase domains